MLGKFFFGFENTSSESINKKLKDPNTTLEDLLKEDEEELLDELRSQNNDLIKFFNNEKIKQMLNYITKEQKDDKLKGYKFPLICSQIFALEIDDIMKYFFITNRQMQKLDNNDNNKIKKNKNKNDEQISELDTKEVNQSEDNESQPENQENKIELIDYLFNNFFPEDKSVKLNYVLCGYFSSLINNLLEINSLVFLKYIYFERHNFLDKMVSHSYRKSISDTLSKLLLFESRLKTLDENQKEEMRKKRNFILSNILEKINIDMDNEDLNSIYFFITGLIDKADIKEKKPVLEEIIKEERIIKSIITKPFHNLNLVNIDSIDDNEENIILLNRRKNLVTLVDIISFFVKNIIKLKLDLPSNVEELKSINNKITLIGAELSEILKPLLENNFFKKNKNEKLQLQSFNNYYLKPLGEYKIKIIELLTNLIPYFKNVSNFFDKILIQVNFLKSAFKFLLEYEWNNLYQESLLNLLKTFFDNADNHRDIIKHLIEEIKIFDIIQAHTNLNNIETFNFTTTQDNALTEKERKQIPIKRGYYSFFIN